MVRSKVKHVYIKNDSARRATYRKRSKGLIKKVSELSTLCDVPACAIIYSPYSPEPEVWSSPEGAKDVLTKYRRMLGDRQVVKTENQESFIKKRIGKAKDRLEKLQMENRHKEVSRLMFRWLRGERTGGQSVLDFMDMAAIAEEKIKEIASRIGQIKRENQQGGQERSNGAEH